MSARRTHRLVSARAAVAFAAAISAVACAGILDIPSDLYATSPNDDAGTSDAPSDEDAPTDGGADTSVEGRCTGTIRVKVLVDDSGPTVAYKGVGQAVVDALREYDEQGGILGCPVEFEVRDFGYSGANALALYDEWSVKPEWQDVSAIFGWVTVDTLALGPKMTEDKKLYITNGFLGRFASPLPVAREAAIPEMSASFQEETFLQSFKSDGYPYVFFLGTDYSTSARLTMLQAKVLGAKRIGFVRSSDEYARDTSRAAREYARRQGLAVGRELIEELTASESAYVDDVFAYFEEELAHKADVPSYEPVNFLWAGNLTIHTAWIAKAIARVQAELGHTVQIMAHKQAFNESLLACADCVDRVHGILSFPAFGDPRIAEMSRITALHDKWRKRDFEAELADAGAGDAGDAGPRPRSYAGVAYVAGYANALLFKLTAERLVRKGLPVTGENLKSEMETLSGVDTGGLTRSLSFRPTDHRPQSSEPFYRINAQGQFVLEAERSLVLEDGWLGW